MIQNTSQARLSVSTWSLHRSLGKPTIYGPESRVANAGIPTQPAAFSLLELPARIAAAGIHTLEICHFHLPSLESAYLQQLRAAIDEAGVELWSLLIDAGDITSPQHKARDLAWIEAWLAVAGALGAKNARVIAGRQGPSPATLAMSEHHLRQLAASGRQHGVRVMTENWLDLLTAPEFVLMLLDKLAGEVGLCADFGNWKGATKYDDLAQIFPRADSCHAKCHFSGPGELDRADFVRCLELCKAAGFAGPYTLIYDGPDADEFAGLRLERELVLPYL
jgi:sugar phosphate isomerase/epimerase